MYVKKVRMLMLIGIIVVGLSAMPVSADEVEKSEVEITYEEVDGEKRLEEPLIIASNSNIILEEDEISGKEEILPLIDDRTEADIKYIQKNGKSDSNVILGVKIV